MVDFFITGAVGICGAGSALTEGSALGVGAGTTAFAS
jgi:hypothetical protein